MISNRARIVAIAGLSGALICVAALHLLRTDLSPVSRRLSEYAVGSYGWVMTGAFITLSCGLLALGIVLWTEATDRIAWAIPAAAFVAACGAIISALFKTGSSDLSEAIHSRASGIAVVSLAVLAVVYSILGVRGRPGLTSDRVGAGLAMTVAILAAVSPLLHETRWTGLSQRALWFVLISWLLRSACRSPLAAGARPATGQRRDDSR